MPSLRSRGELAKTSQRSSSRAHYPGSPIPLSSQSDTRIQSRSLHRPPRRNTIDTRHRHSKIIEGASRLSIDDPATQFRKTGVALLRALFTGDSLFRFQQAADRCFNAIDHQSPLPERYRYNPISNSLLLTALLDFGVNGAADLLAPLSTPGLEPLFTAALGFPWTFNFDQSWLRRKSPLHHSPALASHNRNQIQDWHQDGALGVRFPPHPGSPVPMTQLLTLWIPLQACGIDSPGLEFIRRPQPSLLHFTELDDAALRRSFQPEDFWAPTLEPGDGLVFLNSLLHRTHTTPSMKQSRTSIEYRIFPKVGTSQEIKMV
jgi:hypothetical protein